MENEIKILSKTCIKSKTGSGHRSKQYFSIREGLKYDKTLLVEKYILINLDDKDFYTFITLGSKVVKRFKNKCLLRKSFGIKVETLSSALELLDL